MSEALEKWSVKLFKAVLPNVYKYVVKINNTMKKELSAMGITDEVQARIMYMNFISNQ